MHNDTRLMLRSTLEEIIFSLNLIQKRFQDILTSDDFLKDEQGIEKLDSFQVEIGVYSMYLRILKILHLHIKMQNHHYHH